jgi:hypothetical protein
MHRDRNGVVSESPPGVAAADTSEGQPPATGRAVTLEGLDRILRTAGHVPARRRPAGPKVLVPHDQGTEETHHRTALYRFCLCAIGPGRVHLNGVAHEPALARREPSERDISDEVRSPEPGLNDTRYIPRGTASESTRCRNTARSRRRSRFLTTALPTERGSATASWVLPSGWTRAIMLIGPLWTRIPSRRRRSKSRRRERDSITH